MNDPFAPLDLKKIKAEIERSIYTQVRDALSRHNPTLPYNNGFCLFCDERDAQPHLSWCLWLVIKGAVDDPENA